MTKTAEWLVDNYLPNKDSKWTAFYFDQLKEATVPPRIAKNFIRKRFTKKYFAEALKAFEQSIRQDQHEKSCREQKEALLEKVRETVYLLSFEYETIDSTPMPELKTK